MSELSRQARMYEVARARLAWVAIAAEHTWHRHNVSALLRTADSFGVHRAHLVGERAFEAVKAQARGADRWLDVHHHATAADAIAAIAASGAALWVADLDPDAVAPEDVPLDRPVCLWVGAELAGVGPEARAAAAGVVTLPMRGMARSLNLAAAATAILHVLTARALRLHGDAARLPPAEVDALLATWSTRAAHDDRADADQLDALARPLSG